MDDLYVAWNKKALEISEENVFHWKSTCPEVLHMLEHVKDKDAKEFAMKCISEELTHQQIQVYATMCDSVGTPTINRYPDLNLTFSNTCIRYLYHAIQIVKMNPTLPIVEIGGGYGGLALAIDYVAKLKKVSIPSYTIIDLPNVQKLQEYYLRFFKLDFPVYFASTHESPCFLVSNYALAEMGKEYRNLYISNLILPYVQAGFLVWNSSEPYDFLSEKFELDVEDEVPQTGTVNKVIRFKINE